MSDTPNYDAGYANGRRDGIAAVVAWLRAGPPHDHIDYDHAYADSIEQHFLTTTTEPQQGTA